MKTNVNNKEKVNELISSVEKNAKQRLMQSYEGIMIDIEKAEKKLISLGIAKKYWINSVIHIEPEKVANSYKYRAEGTHMKIKRFASGWFVIGCFRGSVQKQAYGSGGNSAKLYLSDEAKSNIPESWDI